MTQKRICFGDCVERESRNQPESPCDRKTNPVCVRPHHHPIDQTVNHYDGPMTMERYLEKQLDVAEQAIACTEYLSRGGQEKMIVIFDFGTPSNEAWPPASWQVTAIQTLQRLYPERIGKLIILDPPFWMKGLHKTMVWPLVSSSTRNKIQIVSGQVGLGHLSLMDS